MALADEQTTSRDIDVWSEVDESDTTSNGGGPYTHEDLSSTHPESLESSAFTNTLQEQLANTTLGRSHREGEEVTRSATPSPAALSSGGKKQTTVLSYHDDHYLILWPSSYATAISTAASRTSLPASSLTLLVAKFGIHAEVDESTWSTVADEGPQHLTIRIKNAPAKDEIVKAKGEGTVILSFDSHRLSVDLKKVGSFKDLASTAASLFDFAPNEARYFIHSTTIDCATELTSEGGVAWADWISDGQIVYIKKPDWPSDFGAIGKESIYIRHGTKTVLTSKPRKSETHRFVDDLKSIFSLPSSVVGTDLEFYLPEGGIMLTEDGWAQEWDRINRVILRLKESEN